MSMMTLKCPKCGTEAKVSFADNNYSGPRRCWKCHEYFTITIENNRVTFCEPLSAEEYQRQQDAKKAEEKGGGGIGFARQGEPQYAQPAAEPPQGRANPPKEEEVDLFRSLAGKSKGGIDFSPASPSSQNEYPPAAPTAPKKEAPAGRADDLLFSSLKSKTKSDSPRPAQADYAPAPLAFKDMPKPNIPVFPPSDAKSPSSNPPPKAKTYITPGQQADPKKPAVFPPDQIRTFVPQEDVKVEPPKPKKKDVPHEDAWNSFIPPQT
jgi:hypothetical protein